MLDELDTSISTKLLTRIIVGLIAAWSLVAGLALALFHGAASGALGAGVADPAGQRLVGAHMLLLVPVYALIAWRPERFQVLHWLPFAGQAAFCLTVSYCILSGVTGFSDGILPVAVSGIFIGLLAFIWIVEQRAVAKAKLAAMEAEDDAQSKAPVAETTYSNPVPEGEEDFVDASVQGRPDQPPLDHSFDGSY
jgi:hypothetical protein